MSYLFWWYLTNLAHKGGASLLFLYLRIFPGQQ
jgi:hypothetical protein